MNFIQQYEAGAANPKIVIRIFPSPGNFDSNHRLNTGPISGVNYCDFNDYRTAQDVANEMIQIHDYNAAHGISEYGFKPANEPNLEWYGLTYQSQLQTVTPWSDMYGYFFDITDLAAAGGARSLTPPMAQGWYAEGVDLTANGLQNGWPSQCVSSGTGCTSGYSLMEQYYTGGNYGIDWHNYWQFEDTWYQACGTQGGGGHVPYYFPIWMLAQINSGGGAITEADLRSPAQDPATGTTDKDSSYTPTEIGAFITNEDQGLNSIGVQSPAFVADQILSVQLDGVYRPAAGGEPAFVADQILSVQPVLGPTDTNAEQEWHEAYEDATPAPGAGPTPTTTPQSVSERPRFTQWYVMGCPDWDVNCDHVDNIEDLGAIGIYWQQAGSPGFVRADALWQGVVNIVDLTYVGDHWGDTW